MEKLINTSILVAIIYLVMNAGETSVPSLYALWACIGTALLIFRTRDVWNTNTPTDK